MSAEAIKTKHMGSATISEQAMLLGGASFSTRLRFSLAGILRWSERFAERVVCKYDDVFALRQEDTADIYLQLGSDFTRNGHLSDAVIALQRTLALQPNNPHAWFHLGLVYLKQEAMAAAITAFQEAKRLGMTSFPLYFQLATALGEVDRYEEAVEEFHHALEQRPGRRDTAETAYRLGVALDHLKRFPEAVAAFKVAIEQEPKVVSYYQSLGFTLESMGQRDEAIYYFKRAVTMERRQL